MSKQKTTLKKNNQIPPENPYRESDDPQIAKIYQISTEILTSREEITHIAIQKKPLTGKAPDAIVFTDRRFIIYRPKMFGGATFCDHSWEDVKNTQLEEGIMGAMLTLTTAEEKRISIDYLPKSQARRLYSIAREIQETVKQQKRACEMEAVIRCNQKNTSKTIKPKRATKNTAARGMFKKETQAFGLSHS